MCTAGPIASKMDYTEAPSGNEIEQLTRKMSNYQSTSFCFKENTYALKNLLQEKRRRKEGNFFFGNQSCMKMGREFLFQAGFLVSFFRGWCCRPTHISTLINLRLELKTNGPTQIVYELPRHFAKRTTWRSRFRLRVKRLSEMKPRTCFRNQPD